MPLNKNNVTVTPGAVEQDDHIHVSRSLDETWHLSSYPYVTMKCGTERKQVLCIPGKYGGLQITCAPGLIRDFHLPQEPLSLGLSFKPETGELEIGPIIAVLTVIHGSEFKGPLVPFCEELARYSEKKHALFYGFTLKDWQNDTVIGYMRRHNRWCRLELPQPRVIYNRIGSRKLEQLPATRRFFQSLAEKQIPYFNAHFLDKWDVHEKLAAHPELSPYLPETKIHKDKMSLNHMLQRHSCVFLKPSRGSQGKQIFRIYQKKDHLELDYTTFHGEIERHFSTLDELYVSLESRLRGQPFIIQQGLSLLEHNHRPLDFRMLCHKGQTGTWKMTSAVARLSSEGEFVSNLARGGVLYPIKEVLTDVFPEKYAKQIHRLLGEVALEVANIISLETKGDYAELGIDLALDQRGKPWVIEVNTKPSKNLDPEHEQPTIRPSAKAIIDYGCFLAGF